MLKEAAHEVAASHCHFGVNREHAFSPEAFSLNFAPLLRLTFMSASTYFCMRTKTIKRAHNR